MSNPGFKHISSMNAEGRPGSTRQAGQGNFKIPLDRHFIDERDEEHFESARPSLRGDSNFHSVIEYENSQYAMDGRINPLMLKKKAGDSQELAKNFSKAQSPTQFSGQQRTGMASSYVSPYNQIREAPQIRIPSNRLIHMGASHQPQMNPGTNQSVHMNSQVSMNPSLHRKSSGYGGSPQHGGIQALPTVNVRLHPLVEVASL